MYGAPVKLTFPLVLNVPLKNKKKHVIHEYANLHTNTLTNQCWRLT